MWYTEIKKKKRYIKGLTAVMFQGKKGMKGKCMDISGFALYISVLFETCTIIYVCISSAI